MRSFPLWRPFPTRTRRWGISFGLARWLMRHARDFDVVHTHGAWTFTTLTGLLAAKRSGCVAVLTPHESLTEFDVAKSPPVARAIKLALRRVYLRSFDLVVAASALEQRDVQQAGNHAAVVVVPHPVEATGGEKGRNGAQPGQAGRAVSLGFLGRFDPKKNLDVLIRAVAGLPDGVVLRVAGDGSEEVARAVRRLAAELGVEGRIEWLGFLAEEDKPSLFRSIDLLVMPSVYECFGMAAAEALAAGVPVLVSPRTGIAEVVAAYDCGFIVQPEAEGLARVLRSAVADVSVLRTRARRARVAAERELSLEAHGRRLRHEYEALLADRPAPAGRALGAPTRGAAR